MTAAAQSVGALQEALRTHSRVLPRGAGTKSALSVPADGVTSLDLGGHCGIVDYDPAELTFTARAGTPVREVETALSAERQHLPFDPPWRDATLGGVVAAGTSGPASYRHGGVRDFVIGVDFLDGTGTLVHGGGRVVKNAAGFDLPKLMVGSMGRLGILVALTFKVFPRPEAWTTIRAQSADLESALEQARHLARGPITLDALELEPPGRLWIRVSGPPRTLAPRCERLIRMLDADIERFDGHADARIWSAAREVAWAPAGAAVVKAALTPSRVATLDAELVVAGAARRYSRAATVAWIAWPPQRSLAELDRLLGRHGLTGLALTGPAGSGLLGARTGGAFAHRVRRALDPDDRFPEV
ncbi:MAG: glycolate oxidase binding subunit [Solirubrobacteraceae bacterium]|jgi:glycolate oxidase FAD binding subunit|nr:glycolate oxidase binding subunit [Solirubrobacteraceae bacterium]